MVRLRKGYADFRARDTELVEVGPNLPALAKRAFRHYLGGRDLEFPYLCDAEWGVHKRYGVYLLNSQEEADMERVKPQALAEGGGPIPPEPTEDRRLSKTPMAHGLFILDRDGVIQYTHIAAPAPPLPTVPSLLAVLDDLPR